MPSDLSLQELAELTGRHPETLRQLARAGRLPMYKMGGRWAITREAADRLRRVPSPEAVPADGGRVVR